MGNGDRRSAEPGNRAREERIAFGVRCLFDRHPGGTRALGHVDALDINRQRQRGRERPAELLVFVRVRSPELMVQVRSADNKRALGAGDLAERTQKCDRIRSARQSHSDTTPVRGAIRGSGLCGGGTRGRS
jgi:hypothetical protein